MAKTFTSFNRSLSNGDLLLEEEYDAKNDETFGASDSSFEDWEQQHEQFAEIEESSKLSEQIENSLSKLLVLDETDSIPKNGEDSIWSVKTLNGETVGSTLLSSLQRKAASSYNTSSGSSDKRDLINRLDKALGSHTSAPKKICTLEELESTLLKEKPGQSKQQSALPPTNVSRPGGVLPMPSYMSTPQQKPYYVPRLPPGLPPVPPQPPHMPPMGHPGSLPPGLMRLVPPPPHFLQGGRAPHPPPGLIFPPNPQFPVNHPYNFPPPPRMGLQNNMHMNRNHHQHLQQQQQRQRYDSGGYGRQKSSSVASSSDQNVDEYAGLMTNREKQWLLNIQMLQLNTGTPYFDDYYYTVYKSRKANNNNTKRTGQFDRNDRGYHNNRNQHRDNRNNERQDNMLTPRVYTPQQFENSLGKLQCGSVTAPRKIIDMDIVTPDKDSDNAAPPRDTRRSKQILLELEAFYTLFLKAVDLKNPMAINDMEKLREMKQKQRLKELEAAPTPEQKQEILKLLQQESVPVVEDQRDYLVKIVNGLLQDDKFASYFNYSKGKMLVLRLLPYLTTDAFFKVQLKELGFKILLSIPAVMKRDALGDNILPRFYPFWKSQTQTYVMSDVIKLTTTLTEALGLDSVRSTPISQTRQRPKPRLHYVLSNKFGVSALSALVMRVEALMSSEGEVSETQHRDWCAFFKIIIETLPTVKEMQTPIESVPHPIFTKHIERFDTIPTENKMLLLRLFVDRDHNAPIS